MSISWTTASVQVPAEKAVVVVSQRLREGGSRVFAGWIEDGTWYMFLPNPSPAMPGEDGFVAEMGDVHGDDRWTPLSEDAARYDEIVEALSEINPDALLADGFERALIGHTSNHHHPHVAVYSVKKCIAILVERDGMTEDEAEEFFSLNTLGAYVGENGPLFI